MQAINPNPKQDAIVVPTLEKPRVCQPRSAEKCGLRFSDFDWRRALRVVIGSVIDASAHGIAAHGSSIIRLQ